MQISPTLIFHLIFCIFIFHYFFGDLLLLHNKVSYCENHLFKPSKYQCCPHIETSQLICCANQLTGFYMRATLALNELNFLRAKIIPDLNYCYRPLTFAKGTTQNYSLETIYKSKSKIYLKLSK